MKGASFTVLTIAEIGILQYNKANLSPLFTTSMSDQYAIYSEEKTGVRKAIRRPIPSKPGKNEILIKNVAVASNPKDWKTIVYMSWKGIEGNDTAGYVEAVGVSNHFSTERK